jgi:hypothetical protein
MFVESSRRGNRGDLKKGAITYVKGRRPWQALLTSGATLDLVVGSRSNSLTGNT